MSVKAKTRFGQVVIGPPGSGKTTYVGAMSELLRSLGRKVAIVNLDPANENMNYTPDVDIADLVKVEEVMDELGLGPNGGLVYAMQFLYKNLDWLEDQLNKIPEGTYLMMDCPGQVELYTVDQSMKDIIEHLTRLDFRLAAVHLVDSHYCSDPGKFIAVCLTSLTTMLQIALPHVNLLSKVDLVER
jgi:GTPase SAR1 family protein